jgi:phosphate transport system permease protein
MNPRVYDRIYGSATALCSATSILFIFVIGLVLLTYSYPSIVVNGIRFFTTVTWNPDLSGAVTTLNGFKTMSNASYGILVFVTGTLITSALALLIGVPVAIGIAVFLTEVAPPKLSAVVSFLVELLAGIPSVVYGFWGFLVLGPFLLQTFEPFLSEHLYFIPVFDGPVYSSGLLASGIIVALMIIPIIASISRDAMARTPKELKEGGRALGLTDHEVTTKIVFPYAKSSIFGSIMLGLGRALGETMAVAMVSNSAINELPKTAFYPINTMAAFMAQSLDSAFTDPSGMYVHSLVEMGLVLLAITMIVNVLARFLVRQGFISGAETVVRV